VHQLSQKWKRRLPPRILSSNSKPWPQLLGWLEHQGEYYGKLVTAYRVNGVVPPVSRPKK